MNGLDYAIMAIAVFGAIYGVSRGVLRMATSAASLIAGIYLASVYHAPAAAVVQRALGPEVSPTVGTVLGYLAVFAAVFTGVEIGGQFVIRLLHIVHLSWIDRLGGGVVGAAVASVFAGLGVVLLTALMPSDAPLLRESRFAGELLAYNHALLAYVPGEIRDAYQVRHDQLVRYWLEHSPSEGAQATPTASPGN